MSERERWIVYPLLFLALGAALRDKLLQRTWAKSLVCEQLVMVDDTGKSVAVFKGDLLQAARIRAEVVDATTQIRLAGRPLGSGGATQTTFSPLQLLQMLQRSGVLRVVPTPAAPERPSTPEQVPPQVEIPAVETSS